MFQLVKCFDCMRVLYTFFLNSGELTRKCTPAGLWDETIDSRNCKQAELEEIKDVSFVFKMY